jgi:hypothetical protein
MDTNQLAQSIWQQNTITLSTIVIAAATVAYVIYSFLLWKVTRQSIDLTRRIFESTNRPYVGVEAGEAISKDGLIYVQTKIKNFGSAPAIELVGNWEITVDGKPLPTLKQCYEAIVLLPQAACEHKSIINPGEEFQLSDNNHSLEIQFNLIYKSIGRQEYFYREQQRFDHEHHTFVKTSGDAN